MRGRSLLKETPNSTLCAFCAHRLGQARRPSHVQRRYIQSTQRAGKPPAEAVSVRKESIDDHKPSRPSWGQSASQPGNGPALSTGWGRPSSANIGAIPGGPAAGWGRAIAGANAIPARPGQPNRPSYGAATADLLPHEQRARELMLEREVKSQQREVHKMRPDTGRAGRPEPRTAEENEREAARDLARDRAREAQARARERQSQHSSGGHKVTPRHTIVDKDWAPKSTKPDTNNGIMRWSMLRRRGDESNEQEPPRQENRFAEGRAQREQQAMSASYTPLSSRSKSLGNFEQSHVFKRLTLSKSAPEASANPRITDGRGSRKEQGFEQGFDFKKINLSKSGPESSTSLPTSDNIESHKEHGFEQGLSFKKIDLSNANANASERSPMADSVRTRGKYRGSGVSTSEERGSRDERSVFDRTNKLNYSEDREVNAQDEDRKKRSKSRYVSETPSYEPSSRGKDKSKAKSKDKDKAWGKDKPKKKAQFVRTEADEDADDEALARAEEKRRLKKERADRAAEKRGPKTTPILLPEFISVSNLAVALRVKLEEFVAKMEELGFEDTNHDHVLNAENAGLIAMEYNFEPIIDRSESEDLKAREPAEDPSILPQRPPVVTIMGHVDHGKTTLLDWLRKSSVAASEHGGITQHIGAFSVPMPSGKTITFLDTPGHAAFLSMRQRGANMTDIVILVVAADDSVKPQTIEAIKHAQVAKVPIIVAINKIDKDEANIDRVKQDLGRHGVDVEDFGGDTQVVCVSGKTGQGMGELEEAVITLSEILDMRAETDGLAEGWVVEASIKSMGKVATVLVRRGTMRPGDFIVAGKTWARIRTLRSEAGVEIQEATPGTPVEIDGWREQPIAGDEVLQADGEAKAKSVIEYRLEKLERDKMAEDMEAINDHRKEEQEKRTAQRAAVLAAADAERAGEEAPEAIVDQKPKGPKQIYFIVKGDVSGSVEAVIDSISGIGNAEVQLHILRSGVGQVNEFDIEHAAVANGHVINFNTSVDPGIQRLAEQAKVSILDHNIIYRLVDVVKAELSKHLAPLITQKVVGEAEIAQIFEITVKGRKRKNIAGCKVKNGSVLRNAKVRVLRDGEKLFDGALTSLKNVKKDVQEMKKGTECGLSFEEWTDFQVGDQIQCYEETEVKRYV